MSASAAPPRSKAVAAWLALVAGSFGAHRFYLYGGSDLAAWLHPWPTLAGAYGVWRMREFGVDDAVGGTLAPLLGVMLASTMLVAIVYGLTSESRWSDRHGGVAAATPRLAIAAVVIALAVGATVTMATIAFTAQRFYESRA